MSNSFRPVEIRHVQKQSQDSQDPRFLYRFTGSTVVFHTSQSEHGSIARGFRCFDGFGLAVSVLSKPSGIVDQYRTSHQLTGDSGQDLRKHACGSKHSIGIDASSVFECLNSYLYIAIVMFPQFKAFKLAKE